MGASHLPYLQRVPQRGCADRRGGRGGAGHGRRGARPRRSSWNAGDNRAVSVCEGRGSGARPALQPRVPGRCPCTPPVQSELSQAARAPALEHPRHCLPAPHFPAPWRGAVLAVPLLKAGSITFRVRACPATLLGRKRFRVKHGRARPCGRGTNTAWAGRGCGSLWVRPRDGRARRPCGRRLLPSLLSGENLPPQNRVAPSRRPQPGPLGPGLPVGVPGTSSTHHPVPAGCHVPAPRAMPPRAPLPGCSSAAFPSW